MNKEGVHQELEELLAALVPRTSQSPIATRGAQGKIFL